MKTNPIGWYSSWTLWTKENDWLAIGVSCWLDEEWLRFTLPWETGTIESIAGAVGTTDGACWTRIRGTIVVEVV